MRDLDLVNPKSLAGGPNLHLKGPTPVAVIHGKIDEVGERDGPERRQVLEAFSKETMRQSENQAVAQPGVREDRPDIPTGTASHPENEISLATHDRRDDPFDFRRIVTSVGVDEDQHVGRIRQLREMTNPSQARGAVSALRLVNDLGTERPGYLCGRVLRIVVGHHDEVNERGHLGQDPRKRLFLVQRGHEDRDPRGGAQ